MANRNYIILEDKDGKEVLPVTDGNGVFVEGGTKKLENKLTEIDSKTTELNEQLDKKANKKEMEYINVKLYGAKGDGVTDDTQSIKNALVENNNLYFPPGIYIISESITLSKSTNIKGESQIYNWGVEGGVILKGIHDDYIFKCSWGNQNNFYKLNFEGKGIYNPCSAFIEECGFTGDIGIYHARTSTISRCVFKRCDTCGMQKMVDSKILNCFFYSNEIGIYMYDSNDNIIEGNKIEWNNVGIQLDTNVFNLIQGNIFDRNTTYGIDILNGSQLSIKNNQFERNLINHIRVKNSHFNIIGNSFYEKNSEDNGSGTMLPAEAINLASAENGLISGNTVKGNKMFTTDYAYVKNVTIIDNIINGVSDNPKWINIGSITLSANSEGTLRFQWENLDFLNANGYDIIPISIRYTDENNIYYNNCSFYMHYSNGLYVTINNVNDSEKTFQVYIYMQHKTWNKR